MVSIIASVFQIQPYAQFILRVIGFSSIYLLFQVYLPQIPFVASEIEGGYNVLNLNSQVMPGFVMLACACIISTVLGWELLNKCGEARFNSDKFLGGMGYVLGEPGSVRQNTLWWWPYRCMSTPSIRAA